MRAGREGAGAQQRTVVAAEGVVMGRGRQQARALYMRTAQQLGC
jgi:hypothetical protein